MRSPHRLAVPLLVALLVAGVSLSCLGCGGGRVPDEFRPDGRLDAWSDDEWAFVLDEVATEHGFVEWDKVKKNTNGVRDALFRYVGLIGQASPDNRPDLFATEADELAYFINAYNALCMYGVVQRGYPGNVLRPGFVDPGSLFFVDQFRVGGENTTLNGLERVKVLDKSGRDPRTHFAVNCMSFSCPPLRDEPFVGDRLDEQLDDQGLVYLSDPRAAVRDDEDTVRLNKIFTSYYKSDFTDGASGEGDLRLINGLLPYAGPDSPIRGATDVAGLGYKWELNEPPAEWPPAG